MIIGFIGDVHGKVFNAIAVAAMWQAVTGKRFDLLIQLGDLGAFPDPDRFDEAGKIHVGLDPSELDFQRLLQADGRRAELLRKIRDHFASPIYFLRGNHEDFEYLNQLEADHTPPSTTVDPFDLYRYVPDGTVIEFGDMRIAFLGGIETTVPDARSFDGEAYAALAAMGTGAFDILVTHEPPYGISVGFRGNLQGSKMVTELIERTQPAFHLSGHLHHLNGPRTYGRTTSLSLSGLDASSRWAPHDINYQPGCLATLDTETSALTPVTEQWLTTSRAKKFDPDTWFENFVSS
jgi:Icc-related predicted phosphoesterase